MAETLTEFEVRQGFSYIAVPIDRRLNDGTCLLYFLKPGGGWEVRHVDTEYGADVPILVSVPAAPPGG